MQNMIRKVFKKKKPNPKLDAIMKKYKKAEVHLKKAIDLNPDITSLYVTLGNFYLKTKKKNIDKNTTG